jgi:hypothetical protein
MPCGGYSRYVPGTAPAPRAVSCTCSTTVAVRVGDMVSAGVVVGGDVRALEAVGGGESRSMIIAVSYFYTTIVQKRRVTTQRNLPNKLSKPIPLGPT